MNVLAFTIVLILTVFDYAICAPMLHKYTGVLVKSHGVESPRNVNIPIPIRRSSRTFIIPLSRSPDTFGYSANRQGGKSLARSSSSNTLSRGDLDILSDNEHPGQRVEYGAADFVSSTMHERRKKEMNGLHRPPASFLDY